MKQIAATTKVPNQVIAPDQFQPLPAELRRVQGYAAASVEQITKQGKEDLEGTPQLFQDLKLVINSGTDSGKEITIHHGGAVSLDASQLVHAGERVILAKTGPNSYYIADTYRLPYMFLAFMVFVFLVVYFGRMKGLMSILGLAVSIFVLLMIVVPLIVNGYSPLLATLIGSFLIATVGMFFSHGFQKRTVVAVVSTLFTLVLAIGLSMLFVNLVRLSGAGSEEALYFKLDPNLHINLQGLLLGGIIIGTLGVLDDVTSAQVASVDEIHKANDKLSVADVYRRGISVGHEHIASVVNTLVLAYAGASLPLFLLFTLPSTQPLWVTMNSEFVAQEVIRTLVGSMALILAVPISTYLASKYLVKKNNS